MAFLPIDRHKKPPELCASKRLKSWPDKIAGNTSKQLFYRSEKLLIVASIAVANQDDGVLP